MTSVTPVIYGASWCKPCTLAKRYLTNNKVEFIFKDIEQDEGAHQTIIDLGYQSVPVFVVGDTHFQGMDRLKDLVK